MLTLLVFVSALAAARADCDACIQGICHSKNILIEGFPIRNQLAIDRSKNILYFATYDNIIAFFLDEAKMRNVHKGSVSGLAVDQDTQVFYSSQSDGKVYAYKYEQGDYTEKIFYDFSSLRQPARLRYEDTLYSIFMGGKCAYYDKTSKEFSGYDNLENFHVTDMVNVRNATQWFFSSSNRLYRFSWDNNGKKTWDLISDERHILSIGKYGDVYFGNDSEKVIYILDRETKEMKKYGAYWNASLDDFVIDSKENIVFLDQDHAGYVARWVSTGVACIEPHVVKDLSPGKSFLLELVQGGNDASNFTYVPTALSSKELYEVIEV